jgi:hypothetical protein
MPLLVQRTVGATAEAVEDGYLVGLRQAGRQALNKDRLPNATVGMDENRDSGSGDQIARIA